MGLLKSILAKYVPVNWVTGEVITADKLNRSEQGIVDLENQLDGIKDVLNDNRSSAEFLTGYFLTTVGTIVNIDSPSQAGGWSYSIIECSAGDKLLISAGAYANPCQFAFLDKDYRCIARSGHVEDPIENNRVTAPDGSAYVLVNSNSSVLSDSKRKLRNLFSHGSDIQKGAVSTSSNIIRRNFLNLRTLFEQQNKNYGGVSLSIDNSGIIGISGTASYTFTHDLYQQSENNFFQPGKVYAVHIDGQLIQSYLALQIIAKRTAASADEALLTAWKSGDYIITIPDQLYSIVVKIVCLNGAVVNTALIIDINEADNSTLFKTSQFGNSLVKAVKYAQKFPGSSVLIDSGTIDIVADLIAYYGETFFTSYDHTVPDGWGLVITNGLKLKGLSDSVVTCDPGQYQSETNDISTYFSPLMLAGDCSLENLKIISANTKYCVHDDWTDKTVKARHEFHNCVMIKNDSLNRCLGGGLTNSSEIIIKDCYFKDNTEYPISYHNCVNADALSRIIIDGNYFYNGGIRLANYGPSTEKTVAYIHGNSYKTVPAVVFESADFQTENMDFLAWNNELRS